jgi:sulfoxide reductase heme-binding subunit YedZ
MRGAWQTYHDRDGYRWCWPLLEPWYDHGSVTRRQVRHLCLAGFVALVCIAAYAVTRPSLGGFRPLSLGLGYASLALLLLTLATGPWLVIAGQRVPVSTMFRRDVGIWAGVAGCLHVVFGLQSHHGGQIARYFFVHWPALTPDVSVFGVSNWIGAAATLVLLGLLMLSNNLSLRALGTRRWKLLQRFNYLLAALTVLHTFGYQSVGDRGQAAVLLSVGAVVTVVLLQLLGFRRMQERGVTGREQLPQAGAIARAGWRAGIVYLAGGLAVIAVLGAGYAVTSWPENQAASRSVEPRKLTVRAVDRLRFDPASLSVKVDRPVQITLKNAGNLEHDFVVAGMPTRDVRNEIQGDHAERVKPGMVMGDAAPNGEAIVEFTPTRKGSYEFYCSVPGHREAGMKGRLRVE